MPLAGCMGVPSPWAPSTSENGFIASGTSARCDLPSEPLEVAEVLVEARRVQVVVAGRFLLDPDGMGAELPVRRGLDAEVAVFHEAPEAGLVDGVLREARAEQLLGLAHLDPSRGALAPVTVNGGP